jgi:CRP-like cAMP-binding protein
MERIQAIIDRYKTASADDWQQWFNISTIRQFEKGQVLIKEGEIARVCAFVLKGTFKNTTQCQEDEEKILGFGFETDFLASCESYNCQQPSAFAIVAMEPSLLMVTDNDRLVELCYKNQQVANAGFLLTIQLMQEHEEHLKILSLNSPLLRYEYMLKNHPELLQKVSLTDLAKYLYVSREALSRARKQIAPFSN